MKTALSDISMIHFMEYGKHDERGNTAWYAQQICPLRMMPTVVTAKLSRASKLVSKSNTSLLLFGGSSRPAFFAVKTR
jgi:DeoR/GlpR family transcriptional regulator of sugar metabolism